MTLVAAGFVAACGATKADVASGSATPASQPLLRVYVTPWRVEANGRRVSLAQLESGLEALRGRSGFITLDDESETRPALSLTDAQTTRMKSLSRKVLSLAERYDLRVGWPPTSDQGG